MSFSFADSSAVVRAYLEDEPGHEALRRLLLGGDGNVVVSMLAAVEVPRALAFAERAGRINASLRDRLIRQFQRRISHRGSMTVVPLDARTVPRAREIVLAHPVRTLDALHLAAAETARTLLQELVFVTRDDAQRAAAEALGFTTA